ncbi:hypothetical protein LUZ60_002343 [Juncus effusus]|nr:hypothetical protein LUZ60_002343 [Juncus effusus]
MLSFARPAVTPHFLFISATHKPKTQTVSNSVQDPKRRIARSITTNSMKDPKRRIPRAITTTTSNNLMVQRDEDKISSQMSILCGLGYWVQGFRCFPWLGLNFHLAHGIGLSPGTLQLVQNTGNLPMVAKPLFGVLSDSIYIGNARRLPYISIGVFLQLISWGTLAFIPINNDTFNFQISCILLSNFGASITEVVSDALIAEFSRTLKSGELQSYAMIALALGALFGNLSGGYILLKTRDPKFMFMSFSLLLAVQLYVSLTTKEKLLESKSFVKRKISVLDELKTQFKNLVIVVGQKEIFNPLCWIIGSVAFVPVLYGSMFCFQTQILNLDSSIIGLSKVIGQITVLSFTMLYNRFFKKIPLRKLIFGLQALYSLAILSDLLLVKQINISLGISNEIFVLFFSAISEAIAQFKILPFSVLLSSLCPKGCEGSLFAFFTSSLCLASILSGVFGVFLSNLIGVKPGDFRGLPFGILVQFFMALAPLCWIWNLPGNLSSNEKLIRTG